MLADRAGFLTPSRGTVKPPPRLANPRVQRRLGIALIALGGLLSAAGGYLRAGDGGSATYYLDVLGLMLVIAGAVFETRSAQLFLAARPQSARRRALAFAVVGVIAGLTGCIAASRIADDDAPALLSGLALFGLVGGFGLGLSGLLSLAFFYGGDYAARRIETLSEEEW